MCSFFIIALALTSSGMAAAETGSPFQPRSPFAFNKGTLTPPEATGLGATMTRIVFHWWRAEPEPGDPLDFSFFDEAVLSAQAAADLDIVGLIGSVGPYVEDLTFEENRCAFELRCLLIVTEGTPFYTPNWRFVHPECMGHIPELGQLYRPLDMAAWENFVKAVVERYDGDGISDMPGLTRAIKVWQLGAEYPRTWCSEAGLPGADFKSFMEETKVFILEADPGATFKFPGIASQAAVVLALVNDYIPEPVCINGQPRTKQQILDAPNFEYVRELIETPLQSDAYDIADIHLYGLYDLIPGRVAWLRSHVGDVPVWTLEGGGPFEPACEVFREPEDPPTEANAELLKENAAYVQKYYLTGVENGIRVMAWHLPSEYDTWGTVFGDLDLLQYDNQPRPSYYVYQYLTGLLTNDTIVDRLPDQNGATIFKVVNDLTDSTSTTYVVWSDGGATSVDLSSEVGSQQATVYRLPQSLAEADPITLAMEPAAILADRVPIYVEIVTSTAPPVADFIGTPTTGVAPLTVQFTDQSTNATSWSWVFGDSGTDSVQSPSHTYDGPGTYTVSLTVTGPGGSDTETKADYITVTAPPPVADFIGTPTTGVAPLTVQFTDQSTDATSWSWGFGDGLTSSEQSPSHIYTSLGTYTVSLTVTGPGGSDTETKADYITVIVPPAVPVADFSGSPTSGEAPLTVNFTDQSTDATSWSWGFGDGLTSSEQSPSHIYTSPGTYTVSLTVTGPGGSDTETKADYITVTESPPAVAVSIGIVQGVSTTGWTLVSLDQNYESMVVVASPNYDTSTEPVVVRIRNAIGNSFEVSLDQTKDSTEPVSDVDVHYVVAEEGVYTESEHGIKMEAVKFTSTITDRSYSWSGETRSYAQSYANPVVVGQVMSDNDEAFSVFWSGGSYWRNPPSSSTLRVGKHVGQDPNTTRNDETIGYIVIEAGSGTIGTVSYTAALGGDTVRGMDNSPPYSYPITGLSTASVAIVSQSGMDDRDGGWAVLYGSNPVSTSSLNLVIDEDQAKDTERRHSTEQVAYIVFESQ